MIELQADTVQGVLFVAPGSAQDDALKMWAAVFPGDSPDGFQKTVPGPTLTSSASGDRDGFAVTLTVQVGRIDVLLTRQFLGPTENMSEPPRIVDVVDACHRVRSYLGSLANYVSPIRAALILDTAVTIAFGQESSAMQTLLGNAPIPDGANEIVFNFNARRPFEAAPEIPMNRICAFTTGQVGFVVGGPGVHMAPAIKMTPFVGMKIDVNSAPEVRLQSSQVTAILDEIASESELIFANRLERFA